MKDKGTLVAWLILSVLPLGSAAAVEQVGKAQSAAMTELSNMAGEKAAESVSVPQAVPGVRVETQAAAQDKTPCVLAAFPAGDAMHNLVPEIYASIEKGETRDQIVEHMRVYAEAVMRSIDMKDYILRAREETGVSAKQVSDEELAKRFKQAIPAAAKHLAQTATNEFAFRGKQVLKDCGIDPASKPFFAETK